MKFSRTNFGMRTSALGLLVALSVFVSGSRAQQMSDMPYDLHFIDMMIMHHQEGIEMAQMAQTKAVGVQVKAFATKTAADQQKDIEELQAHRNHWYAGKPPMDHAAMQAMMQSMHPGMNMDMEDTRRKLLAAKATAFDRLFLDTMIHHHQMAIGMTKDATTKAEYAELKEFAGKTRIKHTAEIAEMKRLKGSGITKKKPTPKTKPKTATTHKHGH